MNTSEIQRVEAAMRKGEACPSCGGPHVLEGLHASRVRHFADCEYWKFTSERDRAAYPDPEDFQCEWVDYHPDMYPEFAPDPVEDRCQAPATTAIVCEDMTYASGEPGYAGQFLMSRFCKTHGDMWEAQPDDGPYPQNEYVRFTPERLKEQ